MKTESSDNMGPAPAMRDSAGGPPAERHRTDREVDPRLAGLHELYGLLLMARREPGQRFRHNFDPAREASLRALAKAEGFVVVKPNPRDMEGSIAVIAPQGRAEPRPDSRSEPPP